MGEFAVHHRHGGVVRERGGGLGPLCLLYGPMTVAGRTTGDAALVGKLRDVIGVLWLIYPVVWLAGPPGTGVMTALVIVSLDLVTKVGFGVIVLNARGAFGTAGTRVDDAAGTGTGAGNGSSAGTADGSTRSPGTAD